MASKTQNLRVIRGQRLADARRRAGLTADELVQKLAASTGGRTEFTQSAVYAWEKGRNLLHEHIARRIAPILECTAEELLATEQPDIEFNLELLGLGGSGSAQSHRQTQAIGDFGGKTGQEFVVEVSVRSGETDKVMRQRSWRLSFDKERQEIVIRPGEGTTAAALQIFRSPVATEQSLEGRPDYRDMGTLRVPFRIDQIERKDDEPILFLQQSLEALPLFREDLGVPVDSGPGQRSRTRHLSQDIQIELGDFLDSATTRRLVAMWEESSSAGEHLERYRSHVITTLPDAYQQRLQEAVIDTCLLKNHDRARQSIDYLQVLATDDDQHMVDALYLSGRNHWYLGRGEEGQKEIHSAVDDFVEAARIAQSIKQPTRVAQAFIYLARIGFDHANLRGDIGRRMGLTCIQMADMAREIGIRQQRPDIEILAERLHVLRLYGEKAYAECITRGEQLLSRIQELADQDYDFASIGASMAFHVGLAFKNRSTSERDRERAETYYGTAIELGRNDSNAGIATYLTGDLYVDRMVETLAKAEIARANDPVIVDQLTKAAERHRNIAQNWYDKAHDDLRQRGDLKALAKVLYRQVWLRYGDRQVSSTVEHAATTHAARRQALDHELLGASFRSRISSVPASVLQELIALQHLGVSEADAQLPAVSIGNYADEKTAFVVPREIGGALMIQVFLPSPEDAEKFDIKGWLAVPNFTRDLKPILDDLRQLARKGWSNEGEWQEYNNETIAIWEDLCGALEVIQPLDLDGIERAVILAPDSHASALLPIEALEFPGSADSSILESQIAGIAYGGPWAPAIQSLGVTASTNSVDFFADNQPLAFGGANTSLASILRSKLGCEVNDLPPTGHQFDSESIAILAHADNESRLVQLVRSWSFAKAKSVMLLFCQSGAYDLIEGPFSHSLARGIREQLGAVGAVVSNRLPVSAKEALRLLEYVLASDGRVSLAVAVTNYMKSRGRDGLNPFSFPWFVL